MDKHIKEYSEMINLPYDEVARVVNSQFKFTREILSGDNSLSEYNYSEEGESERYLVPGFRYSYIGKYVATEFIKFKHYNFVKSSEYKKYRNEEREKVNLKPLNIQEKNAENTESGN